MDIPTIITLVAILITIVAFIMVIKEQQK